MLVISVTIMTHNILLVIWQNIKKISDVGKTFLKQVLEIRGIV